MGMPPCSKLFTTLALMWLAGQVNATVSTTSLPLQREKRGRKLTEVRWIESCVAVISERKNEPRRKGEELA